MKFFSTIFLLCGLNFSVSATDLPTRIDISYEVKTGLGHGELNETLEIKQFNGLPAYHITSEARASGIFQLIKPGSIERESRGVITKQGLQPTHFSDQRVKKRPSTATFDWKNHVLTLRHKDEEKQETLPAGTLDRLSLSYNFMFAPLPSNFVDLYITDGRGLQLIRYLVSKEILQTPIGKLETIVLTKQQSKHDQLNRKIWLAANHHMLPVRIVSTESDGLKLEKIVTQINLSSAGDH
ncbi:MAG: DUF3108 domain-containing protein [Coxiellaceae bacterium]|nr:DUF3108 domain-containing protein [Coxiellaceae bacterium]MDP1950525.1 DUF3108 domain-containing protein [Nitrosomonas sp.]